MQYALKLQDFNIAMGGFTSALMPCCCLFYLALSDERLRREEAKLVLKLSENKKVTFYLS